MIKWIFFDLDDTLFDFSLNSHKSLVNLWEENSDIRSVYPEMQKFLDSFHFHNARMWNLHERGLISSDYLRTERFRATVFPYRFDKEALGKSKDMDTRYLHLLGQCSATIDGAIELLETLSKRFLIGVLTNGFTDVQYDKLKSTGIGRYVQRMVISDEVGIQKPDERLFRYAEMATGAKRDEILMVGDNPRNDVEGALGAGWKAVWFDRRGREHDFGDSPLYLGRIENLKQLIDGSLLKK